MVLVRFGWIRKIPFICPCSLSPASTEKVDSSKNEEQNKKQKHNQNTESPKATRKIHHIKQQKQKNTKTANNINQNLEFDKFWLFCVFRVCFFLRALVLYVLDPVFFMLIGSFGSTSEGCGQKRLSEKRRPANQSCFFSSATWVSRKNTKSIKLGGQWIPADLWISKNRHTHVKCINLRVHGTLRNPGDAHGMVVQHVCKKYKGSGV